MASRSRGNGEGSIYQRADGRWCATVSDGYGPSGKRRRTTVYGKTREAVRDDLRQLQARQARGEPLTTERQTVEQFLTRWLDDSARPTVRPRTYISYAQMIRLHIVPAIGRVQLSKLTPQHVQKLMNDSLAAGLSPRTVQYMRAILRRALQQALRWQLVSRNVATLVDAPKVEQSEIAPLPPAQARAFLLAVTGHRLEGLFTVALSLGLRQGEALGLAWSDVNLDDGTLTVRKQLQRIGGQLVLTDPKTRQSRRTIALPPVTVAALRRQRVRQLEERLLSGERWNGGWELVFMTGHGTPLDARNVSRQFHAALDTAGLPPMRFHDLRHSAATLLMLQGVSARVVMETLGHSQLSQTARYSHVLPQLQREAARAMDAVLTATSAAH